MRRSIEAGIPIAAMSLWITVIVFLIAGWMLNISKLLALNLETLSIELVLRSVGVLMVPLGSVLGLFF